MNIVFMGTPDFAAASLSALIEAGHTISAVFTQPDKPVGRHRVLTAPPVKELALKHNIEVFQPETLKDGRAEEILRKLSPELIAVVAYGKLIPEQILSIPPLGCINVHGSLLPALRGAAPIQWSVINGEKYAGVTTMYMDKGLDTGDIILSDKTEIKEGETSGELYERLAPMGAQLLLKTVKLLSEGNAECTPQDNSKATYAPMLNKEMAVLDFGRNAKELCSLICGLNPWPVAYTGLDGKRLKVFRAVSCEGKGDAGTLIDDKRFIVACGDGAIELLEVQLEGAKAQSGQEFMRGRRLPVGTQLK